MDRVYICKDCKVYETTDRMEYDKHCWYHHPKDEYQRYWSQLKKSGELESRTLGYQDDPYY